MVIFFPLHMNLFLLFYLKTIPLFLAAIFCCIAPTWDNSLPWLVSLALEHCVSIKNLKYENVSLIEQIKQNLGEKKEIL